MRQLRFLVQRIVPIVVLFVALALVSASVAKHTRQAIGDSTRGPLPPAARRLSTVGGPTQHYEYVFPDGRMSVYDITHGHTLVQQVSLPTTAGVRGVAASPMTHMLYISYGGDDGSHGNGSLLEYNLL